MKTPEAAKELTESVIGLAMKVHRALGPDFVEFVYRNALVHELRRAGYAVDIKKSMQVRYEDVVVGEFNVDLFIDGWLIVELKAVTAIVSQHEVQMVNYLTALHQDFGLLINFGAQSLQFQRKFRRAKTPPLEPPDLHE